jgi:outer membrane lipoprotein-sorting protein
MKRFATTTSLALLAALASAARAETPASRPATNPALWERLVRIDQLASKVTDLSADFEQKKFTPLLRKPLVSTGTIRVKGSAMVWDTTAPEPTQMRIDQREIRLYYPRQATLEIYPIDQQLGSLAASPLPKLDVLKRYFAFEEVPISELGADVRGENLLALRMTPVDAALSEHLDHVAVLLDAAQGLILRAEMVDADGDRTQILFSHLRPNAGLGEGDVSLNVPASTKVSRPLEGLGASPPPPPSSSSHRRGGQPGK